MAALGVRRGGVLLVHLSFRAVRAKALSIEYVISALVESVGNNGTLLLPALSYDGVTRDHPVFDRDRTPSNIGAAPEFFRKLESTRRSVHPTHSVCGYGAAAGDILGNHHLDATPVGEHSPFRAVRDRAGQILMLGCGLKPSTSMHGVEEIADAPYVFGDPITYTIRDGKDEYAKEYRPHGFKGWEQRYDRISDLVEPPSLYSGAVFGAECYLIEAQVLWDTCAEKIRSDPFFFVEKVKRNMSV